MAEGALSPEVRAFIVEYVGSVVQLETLLMVASAPDRRWTAAEVARALGIESGWAAGQLDGLCGQGLAECDDSDPRLYRYEPRDDALRSAVAALARAYAERRVTVISLIFAKPADGLRAFSDAFRLRKDKNPPKGTRPDEDKPHG